MFASSVAVTKSAEGDEPAPDLIPLKAWLILALLTIESIIGIIDRQSIGVLKTTLKGEFGFGDVDYAFLVNAFLIPYAIFYIICGWLVDRFGSRRVLSICVVIWSGATLACGIAQSFDELVAYRIVLGAAEAGLLPASMYALVMWFPKTRIGTAGSIRNAFQALGPILCTPIVVAITLAYGWRYAFILPGVMGIVFGVLWFLADRNPPAYRDRVPPPKKQISIVRVLTSRIIWGVLIARIVSDPLWFFLQYWQAGYLQEKLGLSLAQVGVVLWIPPLISALLVFAGGLFSDRLIARFGWIQARSRIRILQGVACLSPLILVIPYIDDLVLAMVLLTVAYFIANIWLVFTNILATDLFRSTGGGMATAVGAVNALGTAGAALSQPYIGMALEGVGYVPVFLALACLHPIAAIMLQLFYRDQLRAPAGKAFA